MLWLLWTAPNHLKSSEWLAENKIKDVYWIKHGAVNEIKVHYWIMISYGYSRVWNAIGWEFVWGLARLTEVKHANVDDFVLTNLLLTWRGYQIIFTQNLITMDWCKIVHDPDIYNLVGIRYISVTEKVLFLTTPNIKCFSLPLLVSGGVVTMCRL